MCVQEPAVLEHSQRYGIFNCILRVPITFPPKSSAVCSCPPCAYRTCEARKVRSRSTRPDRRMMFTGRAAKSTTLREKALSWRASCSGPRTLLIPTGGP